MLARSRANLLFPSADRVSRGFGQALIVCGLFACFAMLPGAVFAQDADGDGVPDSADNCILDANPDQRDDDNDGFGTICDADYTGDGGVTTSDFLHFLACFRRYASSSHTYVDATGHERFCGNTDHDGNSRTTGAEWKRLPIVRPVASP